VWSKQDRDLSGSDQGGAFSSVPLYRPCIRLPAPSKPVVAVRFCPAMFSLLENVSEKETSSGKSYCKPVALYIHTLFFLLTEINRLQLNFFNYISLS
jgi:hypothetical protein